MNIKKGDVLKYRNEWNGSVTILAIIDDLYFTSRTGNKTGGGDFYTLEGLKETFELPEEKWEPSDGERYYAIHINLHPRVIEMIFEDGERADEVNMEIGNMFKTKEAAEAKLAEILKVLQA